MLPARLPPPPQARKEEKLGSMEDLPAGVPVKKKDRHVIVVGDSYAPGAMLGTVIDRRAIALEAIKRCGVERN